MANPNPELHPENLIPIKPGEVRNPKGYSAGRRLASKLLKTIEEKGLDEKLILIWLAKAMGDKKAL